jgi:hypothetical protein
MANELSCYEQAARQADERGAVPALWAKAFADTVGEPNRARTRYRKSREPTLDGRGLQRSKISVKVSQEHLASAPVQDGNPPALAMSGDDFYRAACLEAHARLLNLPQRRFAAGLPMDHGPCASVTGEASGLSE